MPMGMRCRFAREQCPMQMTKNVLLLVIPKVKNALPLKKVLQRRENVPQRRKSKPTTKTRGGLDRWFKENWVDVKTGKPCGRQKGEKRGYPACRPSKRVSSKTPKTVGEMTKSEKERFKREKTGKKKISYQHRRKKTTKRSKK